MSQRRPKSDRGPAPAAASPPAESLAGRLASWKEIAAYLGVTVRTAQRWERLEGLPVRRHMHASLGSAYALAAEVDAWRAGRRGPAPRAARPRASRSIAVLPFTNLDRDIDTEILADGLTEELIGTLAQVPALGVVARTSTFYFKGKYADVREVGAKLGVDTILEGSVRRAGERVRVVAQLVDAQTGLHVWSEAFESRRLDLLGLQRDLAHAVAGTLRATLSARPTAHERRPESGAYGLYLEGLYHWNHRTPAGFFKAVECFQRAVDDDPELAPAWSALAGCHANATVTTGMAPADARAAAIGFARKALDLDPTLAEPEVWLGGIDAFYSFDWGQAERHFRRAIARKPNLAHAHMYYSAFVLGPTGRLAEAEAHQLLAQRLDPLSAVIVNSTGMLRLMQRRYRESAAAFRAALALDAEYPWAHRGLGEIALLEARYADALEALERVEMPSLAAGLAEYARAKLGREDEARLAIRRLEESGHPSIAYQVAIVHLALGQVDATFEWLARAVAERSLGVIWLPLDPIWDPVRDDTRFPRLVVSMGLDPRAVDPAGA